MNAHINRDLPVALSQSFLSLDIPMARPSAEAHDFDAIDDLLAETEARMAATYFTPLMARVHPAFDGVDDAVANWSVREARAAAWTNGAVLWHLREVPFFQRQYLEKLDGLVGFAGRGLLLPLRVRLP